MTTVHDDTVTCALPIYFLLALFASDYVVNIFGSSCNSIICDQGDTRPIVSVDSNLAALAVTWTEVVDAPSFLGGDTVNWKCLAS